jgi:hypothetical protein
VVYLSPLRQLRIALGQTQDAVADRALGSGRVRPTFTRAIVAKAEAPKPEGLRSHEVRVAIATGLGLSTEDLDSYLAGGLTLADALARSTIRPDPALVQKLSDAETRRGAKRRALRDPANTGTCEKMPGLCAALEVARRSAVPERFLQAYEPTARRGGIDRPGFEWVDDLRAQLGLWLRRHHAHALEPTAPSVSGFDPAHPPGSEPAEYPKRHKSSSPTSSAPTRSNVRK